MARKAKNTDENLESLDDVDTYILTIKELQDFCVRLHKAKSTAEVECRSLQIERNTLKTMVDIAMKQFKEAKESQINCKYKLQREIESHIIGRYKIQHCLMNVHRELAEDSSNQILRCYEKLKSVEQNTLEKMHEIEGDISTAKNVIVRKHTTTKDNIKTLEIDLHIKKSNFLKQIEKNKDLFEAQHKKRTKVIIKNLLDQSAKEQKNLSDYKNKKIKEYLKQNDKFCTSLRHYYEKIKDHNSTILEGSHEDYIAIKNKLVLLKDSLKRQKQNRVNFSHEIKKHKKENQILANELIDCNKVKNELEQTLHQKKWYHNQSENLRWDNLLLEEACTIYEEKQAEQNRQLVDNFQKLEVGITQQWVLLESLVDKLLAHLSIMDQVIDFARLKQKFFSKELTFEQIKQLALSSLQDATDTELSHSKRMPKK
uniref:Uncharacterized protein n=1 Tax=Cuerna arida TaxID=1464854 RepID=A0A1B6GWZ3_9HEMI